MVLKVGWKGNIDGDVGKRVSVIGSVKLRGVGGIIETVGSSSTVSLPTEDCGLYGQARNTYVTETKG